MREIEEKYDVTETVSLDLAVYWFVTRRFGRGLVALGVYGIKSWYKYSSEEEDGVYSYNNIGRQYRIK